MYLFSNLWLIIVQTLNFQSQRPSYLRVNKLHLSLFVQNKHAFFFFSFFSHPPASRFTVKSCHVFDKHLGFMPSPLKKKKKKLILRHQLCGRFYRLDGLQAKKEGVSVQSASSDCAVVNFPPSLLSAWVQHRRWHEFFISFQWEVLGIEKKPVLV